MQYCPGSDGAFPADDAVLHHGAFAYEGAGPDAGGGCDLCGACYVDAMVPKNTSKKERGKNGGLVSKVLERWKGEKEESSHVQAFSMFIRFWRLTDKFCLERSDTASSGGPTWPGRHSQPGSKAHSLYTHWFPAPEGAPTWP